MTISNLLNALQGQIQLRHISSFNAKGNNWCNWCNFLSKSSCVPISLGYICVFTLRYHAIYIHVAVWYPLEILVPIFGVDSPCTARIHPFKLLKASPMVKRSLVGGFNHLEKYESQWEGSHPISDMENKVHVWNHHPDHHWTPEHHRATTMNPQKREGRSRGCSAAEAHRTPMSVMCCKWLSGFATARSQNSVINHHVPIKSVSWRGYSQFSDTPKPKFGHDSYKVSGVWLKKNITTLLAGECSSP